MTDLANTDTDTTRDRETTDSATTNDRRAMLRKIAIGGVGAAAGAVVLGRPVAAGDSGGTQINGNAVELGETNTSTAPTIIDHTGANALTDTSLFSAGEDVPSAGDGNNVFPAAIGGYGKGNVPSGLHGSTLNVAGFGAVAAHLAPALGSGSTDAAPAGLAVASVGGPQVKFVQLPGAVTGPTTGAHVAGELYVDAAGTLWFTVPGPTSTDPVRFVRLAATPAAGAYHVVDPARAYDSRQTGYTVTGLLAPNQSRVISVADGHDASGTVTMSDVVPAGATAVMVNVTAAEQTGRNFLSVTAGGTTSTETSLVNWEDQSTQIANAITVPLDDNRQIRVFCGDQSGSTHVIVDVFGYYL